MPTRFARRELLAAALAAGTAAALPLEALSRSWPPDPGPDSGTAAGSPRAASAERGLFLEDTTRHPRRSTCAALCARIVPSGADPKRDPGAAEARALTFIDRFLAAFELPATLAENPGIYIHGRYSGRNPYPDPATGNPSRRYPPDDFVSADGVHRFLELTPHQRLSWRMQLYGGEALRDANVSARWRQQLGSLIPAPTMLALRTVYARGLDAFNEAALDRFGVDLAKASAAQQDTLLAAAAKAASDRSRERLTTSLPEPAVSLFPNVVVHTFQACYSLPAYGGNHDRVMWRFIGWDGDTQPLGNSIYGRNLAGPGEGPNAGYGEAGVFLPRGGYREFRPVSGPDPASREVG